MKPSLQHITFTGVDARTDILALREIQREYPLAEFGVLASRNWSENGNRFPDPVMLTPMRGLRLNLSLHLCGKAAHDAVTGFWNRIEKLVDGNLDIFKRVQLNVSRRQDNPWCLAYAPKGREIIIQQKDVRHIELYENSRALDIPVSVLLDASGGRGVDTPVEVLTNHGKVGYAGGINPDNVADKLSYLLESDGVGDFWIDMENGVRTDDWFDLNKVVRVLQICREVIDDHNI